MSEVTLFDHQQEFLDAVPSLPSPVRACLYYKTGSGKSLTAIVGLKELGYGRALVIAPPSTHAQWVAVGGAHGMKIEVMSHAKFRMKDTKLSKSVPVIADEFHMFGGQQGQGWRKLDTLARHMSAPLILLSATPNYNDAERVYCVQHILDPHSCKGGYLQFLYTHCDTEQNPFSQTPNVLGFKNGQSAAEYLAALPKVFYLPDDLVYTIKDVAYDEDISDELRLYGYNRRDHRMVASQMEMKHTVRYQGMVDERGCLHQRVFLKVQHILSTSGPTLIYSDHATIATAVARSLDQFGIKYAIVTGSTPKLTKAAIISEFLAGQHQVLIGTATLATGTDGMDRVCDTLLIIDDTEDDSLRRQLVGRIMPRGDFVSTVDKQVIRLYPV
jgi:hypothetical protein